MVDLEDVDIYLDIRESLTTVKTRLNALNLLSETWIATEPTSRKRGTLKRQGVAQNDDDGREIIVSHLDGDDGNRNEHLQAREEQGIGEFVVEHHDDHLSNHGEAGDSEEQTATEEGTQSPPPAVETSVTPANLAPEPSGDGTASEEAGKSAADAIPENKSPFAGIDFSTQRAILMCHNLPTRHALSRVRPRSSYKAHSKRAHLMRLSTSTSISLESLKVCLGFEELLASARPAFPPECFISS